MKISLIIPTYNRANLIAETLQSVINQTYSNWECIIVDDGSSDNTEQVVNNFIDKDARISYYKRPENRPKGANACRNFGFEKSTGDIINWLDSDDLLASNHFEIHLENHKNPEVDCVVSRAKTFGLNPNETMGFWSNIIPKNEPWKDMVCGAISWATPTVTWKRSVLKNKPFCETLQSSQEWFFHTSMLLNNTTFKITDSDTIKVRRHDERIGKSESPQKFRSRFLSRLMVYKNLSSSKKLNNLLEFHLFRIMLNALKKSAFHGYLSNVLFMSFSLLRCGINSIYWKQIYRAVVFGVPVYLFFKKGETLFKFKERH